VATFNLVADTRLRQLVGRTGSDLINNLGYAFTIDTHTCFGTGATPSTIIGSVTGSSTLGGDIKIRGDQTRLIPYDGGSGTVPAYDTVITGSGGGSGLLQGVYTTALNAAPLTPGAAMPASGYFLLSEWNNVSFPDNNTLTGISAIVCIDHILGSGTDRWGWVEVVGVEGSTWTINGLNNQTNIAVKGKPFQIGTTPGTPARTDTYQIPTNGRLAWHPGVFLRNPTPATITNAVYADEFDGTNATGGWITATATGHNFTNSAVVEIAGITPTAFNTTRTMIEVIDANTIKYFSATDPGTYTSGGTITGTYEFWANTSDSATNANVATDDWRGHYCWIDTATGTLRFGSDGINSTGGALPPAGYEITIGNVFLQNAATASPTINTLSATLGNRYKFGTGGGGSLEMEWVSCSWRIPISVGDKFNVDYSGITKPVTAQQFGSQMNFRNSGMGSPVSVGGTGIDVITSTEGALFDNFHCSTGNYNASSVKALRSNTSDNVEVKFSRISHSGSRIAISNSSFESVTASNISVHDNILSGQTSYATGVEIDQRRNFRYYTAGDTRPGSPENVHGTTFSGITDGLCERDYHPLPFQHSKVGLFTCGTSSVRPTLRNTIVDFTVYAEEECSVTRSGTTFTFTTASPHNFVTGDSMIPYRGNMTGLSVTAKSVTVTGLNTFTVVGTATGITTGGLVSFYGSGTSQGFRTSGSNVTDMKVQNVTTLGVTGQQYAIDPTTKNLLLENVIGDVRYSNRGTLNGTNTNAKSMGGSSTAFNTIGAKGTHFETTSTTPLTATDRSGLTWNRASGVYTIDASDHKLTTADFVYIYDAENGNVFGMRSVTTLNDDQFTVTGAASGTSSGTALAYRVTNHRFNIMMGAPTTDTASLVTIGGSAQFNGLGYLSALTIGDSGIWEMDYYDISADSFANAYPVVTATSAVQINYYNLYYQIDRGSGFSAWKNLYYQATGATGLSGQPVVTGLSTTTDIAVGNDVSALGVVGVPDGTKVLSVDSASQITLDTNLTANLSSATLIFRETPNETTFPSTGVKIKVKAYVFDTPTQSISGIWIPMLSTSTSRARLYPQGTAQTQEVNVTNGTSGMRVQIKDITSNTELYNDIVSSFPFNWTDPAPYVADREIRVRAAYIDGATGAKLFYDQIIGTATNDDPVISVRLNPEDDLVYLANAIDGSTVTDVTINDTDERFDLEASKTCAQVYAYAMYTLFTEDGIRDLGQTIFAVDQANYRVDGRLIKNTSSPSEPVVLSGGYIVDMTTGNAIDLVDDTGGTLFLAPNHVVSFATGSGVTPSDVTAIANAVQTSLDDDFAAIPTATENAEAVWSDNDTYNPGEKGGDVKLIKILTLDKA